ncbi:hypothetical protein VNO77_19652 [Canavalia gladiata]|uniref:Uncharacterized protein n=1 Tax=Canavalia gladiata TaxID=3824 RepID=A0AAN9LRP6_CANGL
MISFAYRGAHVHITHPFFRLRFIFVELLRNDQSANQDCLRHTDLVQGSQSFLYHQVSTKMEKQHVSIISFSVQRPAMVRSIFQLRLTSVRFCASFDFPRQRMTYPLLLISQGALYLALSQYQEQILVLALLLHENWYSNKVSQFRFGLKVTWIENNSTIEKSTCD